MEQSCLHSTGIGDGANCDGQVLINCGLGDALGFKHICELLGGARKAIAIYVGLEGADEDRKSAACSGTEDGHH